MENNRAYNIFRLLVRLQIDEAVNFGERHGDVEAGEFLDSSFDDRLDGDLREAEIAVRFEHARHLLHRLALLVFAALAHEVVVRPHSVDSRRLLERLFAPDGVARFFFASLPPLLSRMAPILAPVRTRRLLQKQRNLRPRFEHVRRQLIVNAVVDDSNKKVSKQILVDWKLSFLPLESA